MKTQVLYILLAICFLSNHLSGSIEATEQKIIKLVNAERTKRGLKELQEWEELTLCARNHSENMADKRVKFGHDGFEERAIEIRDRTKWKRFGENVLYSYKMKDPLQSGVAGWMKSPGHRDNILDGEYEETGVGVAYSDNGTLYVTQLFVTRSKK